MNSTIKSTTDSMIFNLREIKRGLNWQNNMVRNYIALVYAIKGEKINIYRFQEVRNYLKHQSSFWDFNIRSNLYYLTTLLMFEKDYEKLFQKMKDFHASFKIPLKSSYFFLACYLVTKNVDEANWHRLIQQMHILRDSMFKRHRFLTNDMDYTMIARLIINGYSIDKLLEDLEQNYQYLHQYGLAKGKSTYMISQILLLNDDTSQTKCDRILHLKALLNSQKYRYFYHEGALLGFGGLLPKRMNELAQEIVDVFHYMGEHKDCYGFWHLDKSSRLTFATTLVMNHYLEDKEDQKDTLLVLLANILTEKMNMQDTSGIA